MWMHQTRHTAGRVPRENSLTRYRKSEETPNLGRIRSVTNLRLGDAHEKKSLPYASLIQRSEVLLDDAAKALFVVYYTEQKCCTVDKKSIEAMSDDELSMRLQMRHEESHKKHGIGGKSKSAKNLQHRRDAHSRPIELINSQWRRKVLKRMTAQGKELGLDKCLGFRETQKSIAKQPLPGCMDKKLCCNYHQKG